MEKTLSYADACSNATKTSMRRDENVLVYGLGVDDPKGMYGTTLGLVEEFGSERCFDVRPGSACLKKSALKSEIDFPGSMLPDSKQSEKAPSRPL